MLVLVVARDARRGEVHAIERIQPFSESAARLDKLRVRGRLALHRDRRLCDVLPEARLEGVVADDDRSCGGRLRPGAHDRLVPRVDLGLHARFAFVHHCAHTPTAL